MRDDRYAGRNAVVLGLGLTGFSLARHLARARRARARRRHARRAAVRRPRSRAALPDVPLATGPFTARRFDGADLIAISPGVAQGPAGDRRGRRARRRARRRHRALRARAAAGAEGAGDHRLQRQDHGDRADRRAVPRRRARRRSSPATSATPVLDVLDAHERRRAVARRVRARAVELPARDDVEPRAGRGDGAQRHRRPPRPLRGIDDYAAAKARIFAGGGVQVLNRDDRASLRDARCPAARCRRSAPASRSPRTSGASSPRGDGDAWLARGGALLAAGRGPGAGRPPQRAERARRAGARVGGREDRAAGARRARRASRACRTGCSAIARSGGVLYVDDSKGTTVAATRAALEGLAARSC